MLNTLMIVVISYFVYQVSQILHEIGHAIAYRVVYKSKKWRIETGRGKEIFKSKRIKICLSLADGVCYFDDDYEEWYFKKNLIVFLAGPLVNIILFICMIPFIYDINHSADVSSFYRNIVFITFYVNLWKAFFSLLPKEYEGARAKQSDGLQCLNAIKGMKKQWKSNTKSHKKSLATWQGINIIYIILTKLTNHDTDFMVLSFLSIIALNNSDAAINTKIYL